MDKGPAPLPLPRPVVAQALAAQPAPGHHRRAQQLEVNLTHMEFRNQLIESPYFSVCVPQHNRTSFLLEALRVLAGQQFRDFEVCIADDWSTDGTGARSCRFS